MIKNISIDSTYWLTVANGTSTDVPAGIVTGSFWPGSNGMVNAFVHNFCNPKNVGCILIVSVLCPRTMRGCLRFVPYKSYQTKPSPDTHVC